MMSDDFKPHWERVYNHAASKVELKGFRPGTAPKAMVDAVLNKEAGLHEALQDAVRHTLHDITEEEHWTVIASPKIEITSGEKLLEPKGAIAYKAELTIFPEIKLGDYKGIAKKISAEKKEAAVSSEEVEKSFEWLRKSRAPEIRVARGAEHGAGVAIH